MIITQAELDHLITHLPLEQVLRIVAQAPEVECPGDFPENEAPSGVHSTGNASPQAIKAAG